MKNIWTVILIPDVGEAQHPKPNRFSSAQEAIAAARAEARLMFRRDPNRPESIELIVLGSGTMFSGMSEVMRRPQ